MAAWVDVVLVFQQLCRVRLLVYCGYVVFWFWYCNDAVSAFVLFDVFLKDVVDFLVPVSIVPFCYYIDFD